MFEKIATIALLNILFYAKTICYKYSSDDLPVYHAPPKYKNKLWKIIYWLEGRLRHHPEWDHFLTLIIHTLVCIFIYLGFGANNVSFMAALLFSLNPANNQASVWISGRSYALAALGMTGAMAFPYLSIFFLALATYYNPGFFAPIAFIGSHQWFLLIVPFVWAIHYKRFSANVKYKMQKEMFTEDKAIKPEKLVVAIKTFGFYTALALVPFKITFYHSFLQSLSGSGKQKGYTMKDRFFFIGLLFLGAIFAYWIMVPWNTVSFALLWWCVCIAPFLNFMRMSQEIAERYIYLPNCGLMIVLASVICHDPVISAFFLAMYGTKMWFAMEMYTDDYYLLEHACLNSPDSWFAWHVRGMKRWDNKSFQESVIIWTMARIISPREFKVNFNLATALAMSGHKKEAEQFIKIAAENVPAGQEEESGNLLREWHKGNLSILL